MNNPSEPNRGSLREKLEEGYDIYAAYGAGC